MVSDKCGMALAYDFGIEGDFMLVVINLIILGAMMAYGGIAGLGVYIGIFVVSNLLKR